MEFLTPEKNKPLVEQGNDMTEEIKSQSEEHEEHDEDLNNPHITSDEKKIRKRARRSKDVVDGRNHVCALCNKAYLSQPALTNHIRNKHTPMELKNGKIRKKKF